MSSHVGVYHGHTIELTPSGEWFTVSLFHADEHGEWAETYKADTLSGACETVQMWERGELPVQHGRRPPAGDLEMYADSNDTIDYEQVVLDEVESWEEDE